MHCRIGLALALTAVPAAAGEVSAPLGRESQTLLAGSANVVDLGVLRVGTSGDYRPFSMRQADHFAGFDLDVARAFAADRNLAVATVSFRWPELLSDLASDRFDVAMSGVTVRPERSLAGTYSVPVAITGAVVLVPAESRFTDLAALDDPAVRLAVNAGGHLERAVRRRFPRAQIEAVADNLRVPDRLDGGRADGVVTDTLEAPHWRARRPGLRELGPFTRDRKAYLVAPDRPDLVAALDRWLLEREADGRLARLRQSAGLPLDMAPAKPLTALVAAIDERLALMPLVAEAKRASGGVVRVPEREARVIASARRAVADAAREGGLRAPDADRVADFFAAQIAAARAVQAATLAGPSAQGPPPSLARIRGALLRIGTRMARLLVRLPPDLDPATVRRAVVEGVDVDGLPAAERTEISRTLLALRPAVPREASKPRP